ncbi:MAG: glucose 1-dehydrogenase [Deltaproteobacteria bacterium]|nr:MAG: glucose 1-dehydrogenase [Deltaproteobacteria bacterium]
MNGKVALVTGGGSGIGRAASLLFAKRGAKVVVADIASPGGEETAAMVRAAGGDALFVRTDVSRSGDVTGMVDRTVATFGRLDFAFNNAGIFLGLTPLPEYTEEMWERSIAVNLKGVWLCMKYEIPRMLETGGGAIVNTSSIAGLVAFPGHYGYVASKSGVNGITRGAALEYAASGIRVNAVCPGVVDTPMAKDILLDAYKALHPMGRFGTPEDVASTAVWLCSGEASFITGQTFAVDGGYTLP